MRVLRVKRNSKGGVVAKGLSLVLVLSVISFTIAALWQSAQNTLLVEGAEAPSADSPDNEPSSPDEGQIPVESAVTRDEAEADPAEPDSSEASEPGDPPEEPADNGNRPSPAANAVPESARADNSYFEDAIFFGDSLSTGIPLYQVAGNPDTVAYTGIDPVGINTNEVIVTPEGKKTVLEAAKQYGEKTKVYIMLGANALWMEETSFIDGYRTFIADVKAHYPGAVIYIQSILPVTEDAILTYETADNDVINRFNVLLQELARSAGVHYLDISHTLMDETGMLPKEASPMDGMHLTPEYYEKWFDYLKMHTVPAKK